MRTLSSAADAVIGYHGTSTASATLILHHGFAASRNRYDWLGDGAYFFQESDTFPHSALDHATDWARKCHGKEGCVLRAHIDLVDCMDLLDRGWASALRLAHDRLTARAKPIGMELPTQRGGNHGRDRALINYVVQLLEDEGTTIRSVRGAFGEDGRAAFPGSSLLDLTHVQIAVRDSGVVRDIEIIPLQAALGT